ncbi:uncharacterized protein LOC129872585 [Solanum dulcamara]|uniref:uncharacterized protein LOC129872585 n=1 Tax=Solanum dulcamara TaxID=45834 RepID=UPI00248603D5|nr:uncharacterized protein LOC129872585 [Solanum dulcamara]
MSYPKLIVSVVTLLCLIHFSSGVRMLREENDNLFKEEKDADTPANPNIGGIPFPFNFPPLSGGIPNIGFNIPNFNIPGFGIPGAGTGTGANNPFNIPIPGLPNVDVPAPGVPDVAVPDPGVPDVAVPVPGVPGVAVPDPGVPDVDIPAPDVAVSPPA